MTLSSGGSPYFDAKASLDPCQPCVGLATRVGLGAALFGPGVAPLQRGAAAKKVGLLGRLTGMFRGKH